MLGSPAGFQALSGGEGLPLFYILCLCLSTPTSTSIRLSHYSHRAHSETTYSTYFLVVMTKLRMYLEAPTKGVYYSHRRTRMMRLQRTPSHWPRYFRPVPDWLALVTQP